MSPLHVDIVIDLNVKAASSNVLTVVRFTLLIYTTNARGVIDWLYFVLVNSKEQAERKHCHVGILGKEKVVTTRSCRRKSLQLLVSEMFSSGTNST